MNNPKKVSLIVINANKGSLRDFLDRLKFQSVKPHQILIVNSYSRAFKKAQGEICVFIDRNCLIDNPDWLKGFVLRFSKDSKLALLQGDIKFNSDSFVVNQLLQFKQDTAILENNLHLNILPINFALNKKLLLREVFVDQSFNHLFFKDLIFQILNRGFKVVFDRKIQLFYRKKLSLTALFKRSFEAGKEEYWLNGKWQKGTKIGWIGYNLEDRIKRIFYIFRPLAFTDLINFLSLLFVSKLIFLVGFNLSKYRNRIFRYKNKAFKTSHRFISRTIIRSRRLYFWIRRQGFLVKSLKYSTSFLAKLIKRVVLKRIRLQAKRRKRYLIRLGFILRKKVIIARRFIFLFRRIFFYRKSLYLKRTHSNIKNRLRIFSIRAWFKLRKKVIIARRFIFLFRRIFFYFRRMVFDSQNKLKHWRKVLYYSRRMRSHYQELVANKLTEELVIYEYTQDNSLISRIKECSVVVVTRNRSELLKRCLSSLVNQTFPPKEVIIVDNGSTDFTKQVALSFENKLPIRYVYESKPGIPLARNRGVKEVSTPLFLMIDDDCKATVNWIKRMIEAHNQHPQAWAIQGKTTSVPFDRPVSLLAEFNRFLSIKGQSKQKEIDIKNLYSEAFIEEFPLTTCDTRNLSVKKQFIVRSGVRFDERFYRGSDSDLGKQIIFKGGLILFSPQAKVFHRERPSFSELLEQRWHIGRTSARIQQKWPNLSPRKISGAWVQKIYQFVYFCFYMKRWKQLPFLILLFVLDRMYYLNGHFYEKKLLARQKLSL